MKKKKTQNTHTMNTPNEQKEPAHAQAAATEPLPVALPSVGNLPEGRNASSFPPVMDAEGAFVPDWYARFEDLQPYAATLSKFRRPEALAKSYANLERLRGYPDLKDTKRMEAFRTAVGLPMSASEYAISRPENTPDEVWDDALAASLAQVAYEYGVPAQAMTALTEKYADEGRRMLESAHLATESAIEHADAELQQEWGRAYEDNMRTIGDFLHHLGDRAGVDVEALSESPSLRANADFARLMLAAASLLQEAPLRTGAPMDSRGEAHRIAHDPSHPLHEAYMRTSHPQHKYANEQYDRLAFGRQL